MDAQNGGGKTLLRLIDEKIREKLREGVGLDNGHKVAVFFTPDITWVRVDASGYITAAYLKGPSGVTVRARLRGGNMEILNVLLDCMCQGGYASRS
jgi:transglutaminase-like putative cysteine protease